jgi:hypothetical protein
VKITRSAFRSDPDRALRDSEHDPIEVVDDEARTRMVLSVPVIPVDDEIDARVEALAREHAPASGAKHPLERKSASDPADPAAHPAAHPVLRTLTPEELDAVDVPTPAEIRAAFRRAHEHLRKLRSQRRTPKRTRKASR